MKNNCQFCNRTKPIIGMRMIRQNLCARGGKLCSPLFCSIKVCFLMAIWGYWEPKWLLAASQIWAGQTELKTQEHGQIWLTDGYIIVKQAVTVRIWIQLAQEMSLRPDILNAIMKFRAPFRAALGQNWRWLDVIRPKNVFRIIVYVRNRVMKRWRNQNF
jgi:hypothetical protein